MKTRFRLDAVATWGVADFQDYSSALSVHGDTKIAAYYICRCLVYTFVQLGLVSWTGTANHEPALSHIILFKFSAQFTVLVQSDLTPDNIQMQRIHSTSFQK